MAARIKENYIIEKRPPEIGIDSDYQSLCQDLSLPDGVRKSAWAIWQDLDKLDETQIKTKTEWFTAVIYMAAVDSSMPYGPADPHADKQSCMCITVTDLLKASHTNVFTFLERLRSLRDSVSFSDAIKYHLAKLERRYCIVYPLYDKFNREWKSVFREDEDESVIRTDICLNPDKTEARKMLCWTLFLHAKDCLLQESQELIYAYHLLVCCIEYVVRTTPSFQLQEPYDMLKLKSTENLDQNGFNVAVLGKLADLFKTSLEELFSIQKNTESYFESLKNSGIELTFPTLRNLYHESYRERGDLDEIQFLDNDPHLLPKGIVLPTNLSSKDALLTPVRTALNTIQRLKSILASSKDKPDEDLLEYFQNCSTNPEPSVSNRLCSCRCKFLDSYKNEQDGVAEQRYELSTRLYYRVMKQLLNMEKERLGVTDFSTLLNNDTFHRSLLACSIEIVLMTYSISWHPSRVASVPEDSKYSFPWILEVFDIRPYNFYKVIESFIQAEPNLSREIIQHLTSIENKILDCIAWKSGSPLLDLLPKNDPSAIMSPSKKHGISNGAELYVTAAGDQKTAGSPGNDLIYSKDAKDGVTASFTNKDTQETKPGQKRSGPLLMFLNKVFRLGHQRLKSLCGLLLISDDVQQKIWTCFELCLTWRTDLMKNRHLDMILMCCIYGVCKVTDREIKFKDIVTAYRTLPFAEAHVYKSALIHGNEYDSIIIFYNKIFMQNLSSECRYNLTMCRTHALCDSTNPEAGLQCRCNRGFFLQDLTCVPCKTSCETGFYMTQQCGATSDVVCKPCTVCSGTTYAAAQCTSTQDTICIDVTFPIRQFTEKLHITDEQLVLNYTASDNVFLEQLYKIRQLQQRLPMMSNVNQFDLTFDRPSGLAVKIKVKDIYLVPEYVDFDHKDDIVYVMNHRGFPQDVKDMIANVVENYCSHPLPNEYDLHLNIIRNISTAAAEIVCDSKNDKLPACPSGYKDGDRYIYQFLEQPCRKAQESKNTFREHSNNIVCADNPEILSKVFHVAVQNSNPLTFPSDQCKNFDADCKRCLSQSSCTGSHCCADIECYASTSCRNLYTSVCPVAPVQCTRGDISKLSIIPRYSNIKKEFSCHLQHHPPKFLYVFNFTISIPKLNFEFPNRTKEMHYYNISHQEQGSDIADYLIVNHHTNIPMRDEVMLIGTFGEENVDFSLHRLKKSKEFDRNLAFNIRGKSSTSMRTRIQFEKPFLYSTTSWGEDGCDKNVSQIIAPQPLYDTQGQPLKQMSRKKKDTALKQDGGQGKFVYELLIGQTSPHIQFTVPENLSLLSYYKNDLNGSQLVNKTLRAVMVWDRYTLYWNITITGSITACPGYFTVEIYKGTPMTRLAIYDMLVTCQRESSQKNFTLRYFITHHESVDIPDIFTVVLNDSVTSYRLLLSSVRGPQIFHSNKVAMTTTETEQGSPWIPIIAILIVCSILCMSLLIVYAYCDSKQTKGVPPDITMPKPDLGAQITLLQNMDVYKPEMKSTLKSKLVVVILGVLYVIYALSFTFLMLFGLLHLMQGPQFGELGIGSNTSAKIQSKVQSHLNDMVYYETNETTRLVESTQQRLTACSNHLKSSLYGLIPENTNTMRKSLRKVFEQHGTVHSLLKEYFIGRLDEYQPQIQKFIDEFNQTLDRHLHEFQINYKNYLKSIADNRWLEFPKKVFLEQERQEGRRFGAIDDNNRANFLTWLEIDKVEEMITVKDLLMNRMLSMMPKVNFSELLKDLDSELASQNQNFTFHENWIKFTSTTVKKYRLEVLKQNTDNQTTKENAKSKKDGSDIKSIIYPLFIGVFFLLDAFLLIYRFSWLARCVKMFKKGIEQRVPFDSITRKIHFILTGKDIPKEGENLEYPYNCALEALNKKENIWGDNIDKYFIYCQSSAKSREDILKEIFKDRQGDKPKIDKQVEPQKCCCVHFIVKGLQLLYRMFISPVFWRFVLICGFVLLLCLVTKVTNDLVTMESAMFLLDTDAVWPVMAGQESLTNQVISRQGLFLNSFLENYKNFVDVEIQILNSIIIAGTKNQSQLLNSMISDLCNIAGDGSCPPSLAVDLVVPTLTSCNFLPLKTNIYSGYHRAIMSEFIRSELLPLVSNLRSIMFSAFYLLLTFVSAMLVCQISARVIYVYLLKSHHLCTTKIYQLSSCLDQDQQDFTIKDMYEGQSLVAESCESGVYDMTS